MSDEPHTRAKTRQPRPRPTGPGRPPLPVLEPRGPRIPQLDYRLVVLTSGRPCLRETLEAFRALVTPQPAEVFMFDDGGTAKPYGGGTEWAHVPWTTRSSEIPQGFCTATARCWNHAGGPGPPWVFWLEDDFVLTRSLDLRELAAVMDAQPQLAQMALYRNPVSDREHYDGGYLQDPDRNYERRWTNDHAWFEHVHYWTTNPSLFRREIPATYGWPENPECEGRFGLHLREQRPATTYGVWGAGTPYALHVGDRLGFGY